jgi:hypothetical protein
MFFPIESLTTTFTATTDQVVSSWSPSGARWSYQSIPYNIKYTSPIFLWRLGRATRFTRNSTVGFDAVGDDMAHYLLTDPCRKDNENAAGMDGGVQEEAGHESSPSRTSRQSPSK